MIESNLSSKVPGPPMRLVFPEVRLMEVRVVWQPPVDPNGIIMGKRTKSLPFVCFLCLLRESPKLSLWCVVSESHTLLRFVRLITWQILQFFCSKADLACDIYIDFHSSCKNDLS